jgi:hypothetical protein
MNNDKLLFSYTDVDKDNPYEHLSKFLIYAISNNMHYIQYETDEHTRPHAELAFRDMFGDNFCTMNEKDIIYLIYSRNSAFINDIARHTSIVFQGRITDTLLNNLHRYEWCPNWIFSSWLESKDNIPTYFDRNIKSVLANDFSIYGLLNVDNLARRIITTLNGLSLVTTKYCYVQRGDEYYSDLHKTLYTLIRLRPNQICTNNVHFVKDSWNKYQASDHFKFGLTQNMFKMYRTAYEVLSSLPNTITDLQGYHLRIDHGHVTPENFDVFCYLMSHGLATHKIRPELSKTLMKTYFDVIDVEDYVPFCVASSGNTYTNFEDLKNINNPIKNMDEL